MRKPVTLAVPIALVLAALGCSAPEGGSGCGEGFAGRSRTHDIDAGAGDTREDAIRAALDDLGFEASDEAVTEAVVNAIPAVSPPGHEAVFVSTSEGLDVEMTLTPLDPGWAVGGSSWCVPGDQ